MKLRKYIKEDSAIICSWIQDERSLYQWSADRIGKFPLADDDLNENYAPVMESDKFIPLTFCDENDKVAGHLFIRYPKEDANDIVRFGFVILDPTLRGQGYGKKMLQMAIDYAKNRLNVSTVTLGVFANNDSAKYCYESVGFRSFGQIDTYKMPIGEWECIEMELKMDI